MELNQLNIPVRDMDATVAFYRRLGVTVDAGPDAFHVAARFPSGMLLEFDSTAFAAQWDTGYRGGTGGSAVIGFGCDSRAAVDERYADLVDAGYVGRQPPYDAFWGARYAIVEDPDGNGVGLMSPMDDAHRSAPPDPE